jgi:glutathione peroxidase-family protein
MTTVHTFHPSLPDNTVLPLEQYKGQVLLIANTASHVTSLANKSRVLPRKSARFASAIMA